LLSGLFLFTCFAQQAGIVTVLTGDGGDTVDASGISSGISITGGTGNDTFTAGTGIDTLISVSGTNVYKFATADLTSADIVTGGSDGDTIEITDAGSLVDVDFTNVTSVETLLLKDGATNNVTLGTEAEQAGIVTVTATGAGANTINAGGYVSLGISITGGSAIDTLTGGGGGDTITGGAGADTLSGGLGADTYVTGAESDNSGSSTTLAALDSIVFDTTQGDILDLTAFTTITEAELDGQGNTVAALGTIAGANLAAALGDAAVTTALAAAGDIITFDNQGTTYLAIEGGTATGAFNAGDDFIVILGAGSNTSAPADGLFIGGA